MVEYTPTKRCTKCGIVKTAACFGPNRRAKDGLHYWCRECMNAAKQQYYAQYPDKKREVTAKYHQSDKARLTNKRYRDKHPDRVLAQIKRARQRNPEIKRISEQRREARKRHLPDTFSFDDWLRALAYFKGRCAVCGRPAGLWHKLVADHWIPLADPACPGTVATNMIPLCHGIDGCNSSKRHKDAFEWAKGKFGIRQANRIMKRIHRYFAYVSHF